ncbi:MAG: dynamin family protein [Lentisphaeria bacterium]|nr:dynamin family protein [Lentisphaeria bacterium]
MNTLKFVDNSQYLKIAEDLKNIAAERKQDIAVNMLDRSIKDLSSGVFSLAVLGMVKRGKSTFCNALLGVRNDCYAPTGKTPVSNAITFFQKGSKKIEVNFFNGEKQEISLSDIPSYITEQLNPGNTLNVSHVNVQDDFERLPNGVVLMDTPGEGSLNQHHDDLLYKFLPMVDAGIFLITAYSPITESELEFLQSIIKQDTQKMFFVINRVDQTDEDDLRDAIEHNLNILAHAGIAVNKIYPISAKLALEGNWIDSGMEELFQDVRDFLEKEKYRIPRLRFMNKVAPMIELLKSGVSEEIAALSKSKEELQKEIEALTDKGINLEELQKKQMAKLKNVWIQSENKLLQDVDDAMHYIELQMSNYIDTIGFFNCTNAKKLFCKKFTQLVENVMNPLFKEFENNIMTAINQLPLKFTGVDAAINGEVYRNMFMSGTSSGTLKLMLLNAVPLIGTGIYLYTVASVKADLHKQLPRVVKDMRESFIAQLKGLEGQRCEIMEELENYFILEISPTVQALQSAMESKGTIDQRYIERLKMLDTMLGTIQNEAKELYTVLEK